MREVTRTTKAGEIPYPVTFPVFDSLVEALARIGNVKEDDIAVEAPQGAIEAALGVINAAQEQGAKQGGKELIRKAFEDAQGDSEWDGAPEDHPKVLEAIAKHQERAAKYVIGAPRGEKGGVTKTAAREIGSALRDALGAEGLLALAREHGLDPEELGIKQ